MPPPKPNIPRVCMVCGKQFMARMKRTKFCGKVCYRKAQTVGWRQENGMETVKVVQAIMRNCLRCGKEFQAEGKFNRICRNCTSTNRAENRMANWLKVSTYAGRK